MGHRRTHGWFVAVMVVAALVASACAASDDDASDGTGTTETTATLPPQPGGELVYATDAEVDGWNPSSSAWPPRAHTIARTFFDPITVIDENGDWQPYVVEDITANDDFTVWTFTLRDGVRFHNGEVLDATAFKKNMDAIVGGLISGVAFTDVVGVNIVDDMTVAVEVGHPWTQFPSLLSDQPGYVMAPEMIDAGGDGVVHPIGTGPFVFDEWVRDDHLTVVRNDDYWQEGLPYLDSVEFRPMTDSTSLLASLDANDIDALVSVAGSVAQQAPELEQRDDLTVYHDDGTKAEAVFMFNMDTEIGGDERVRQAMAMAIDKQALVNTVFAGQFPIADQPFEPGEPWYVDDVGAPGYDPDAARALVEEWEADNGPLELTVKTVAGPDFAQLLQLVQQQLDEVGIEMDIDTNEVVAFTQLFIAGDFDIVLIGSFFRAADPDGDYHFMHSKNAEPPLALNFPRYRNDVVDQALDSSRASNDLEFRQEQYANIWRAFAEDLPYIFLYHLDTVAISHDDVHGLGPWTAPDGSKIPAVNGSAQWVTHAWVEQ